MKKNISWFVLLLCTIAMIPLQAQQNLPVIDVAKIAISDSIDFRSASIQDRVHTITPDQLAGLPFVKAPGNVFLHLTAKQTESDWWFCFRLKNSADSAIRVYLFPGVYATTIDLFEYNDSLRKPLALPTVMPNLPDSIGYREIILPAGHQALYYVHLQYAHTAVNAINLRIIRDYYISNFSKLLKIPVDNNSMYTYIITGILLMMIFYSMAVFILNGSVEFMYYACFAFFTGLLFFLKSFYLKNTTPFSFFFESYFDFVLQSTGVFFYYIFLRKFLDTKRSFPFLHKLFIAGQVIIIISLSLFTWLNFFTSRYTLQQGIQMDTKILWLATTFIFIIYALLKRNKMLNFLAAGHFFLLALSILSVVLIDNPQALNIPRHSIWRVAIFYYELGMTIELIFFLMALAFKNRNDIIERTRERERLLLENERKEFEKQLAVVEAKQEERNRISTDMHDELGSGVTAIRLMSEIVKTKMKDNTLPEIEKISNNANDLLSKMNTIIWTMSSSNDKLDNMIAYTRSYALEFLESTNIECHFESEGDIPSIEMSGEKRRNVFLCVKETLNNVVKHSKATDVWIKVTVLPQTLEIQIHDNGVGINLQKLREFGNGLNNMKKRIESIEGNFSIINHEGTTTTLTAPL